MPISTWLYNNKVTFAVVTKNEKSYLVCAANDTFSNIKYVEDLKTGEKVFPTQDQRQSLPHGDDLVRALIDQMLKDQ